MEFSTLDSMAHISQLLLFIIYRSRSKAKTKIIKGNIIQYITPLFNKFSICYYAFRSQTDTLRKEPATHNKILRISDIYSRNSQLYMISANFPPLNLKVFITSLWTILTSRDITMLYKVLHKNYAYIHILYFVVFCCGLVSVDIFVVRG